MFDKQLDEKIINMENQAPNWLISPNKRDGQFDEEKCIFLYTISITDVIQI